MRIDRRLDLGVMRQNGGLIECKAFNEASARRLVNKLGMMQLEENALIYLDDHRVIHMGALEPVLELQISQYEGSTTTGILDIGFLEKLFEGVEKAE